MNIAIAMDRTGAPVLVATDYGSCDMARIIDRFLHATSDVSWVVLCEVAPRPEDMVT